jgi:hypothetical protein
MESIRFEDDATKQHLLLFASTSNKNNRGNPRLHNNPAKKLLELDVAAGRANGRKPAELKKDRPEYEQFETIQFFKLSITSAKSRGVRNFGLQSRIRKEHYITFGAERSNYKILE